MSKFNLCPICKSYLTSIFYRANRTGTLINIGKMCKICRKYKITNQSFKSDLPLQITSVLK